MPGINLNFDVSALIVLLLTSAGIAAAIWYYRATLPQVSARFRLLLIALRGLAVSLILILLAGPLLRLSFTSVEPPVLALLIDNSSSMRVADQHGNRADALRTLLRSDTFARIGKHAVLRPFTFGVHLTESADALRDTLPLNEEATNFSAALEALAREREQHHIDAALLVTDGTPTLGRNPVYDAAGLGIPLYAVGIGDTTEPRDLVVVRAIANRLVYSDVPTPVDVVLKSSGLENRRVTIRLRHGNDQLTQTTLLLEPGTREYQVALTYTPRGEGSQQYVVTADVLPEELTAGNNRALFVARVLKSKLHIVLLAGTPSPDVAVLGHTLRQDKNLDVITLTQNRAGGFYEGNLQRRILDSADCVVLLGFPTPSTVPSTWQAVAGTMLNARLPFFLIAGRQISYDRLRDLGPLVPFTVDAFAPTEQSATVSVNESERLHPLIALGEPGDASAWNRLPPLFRTLSFFKARPESRVLAFARTENSSTPDPLLLARSVGGRKSLAMTAYGLWQWRLLVQRDAATRDFLGAFLAAAIRWLTAPEENRPLRVTPAKEMFVRGEPVEFTGQVYDQSARPVDNARVSVRIQHGEAPVSIEMRPLGSGRYEGRVEGLEEGEFAYTATADLNGIPIGTDAGRIAVGGMSLELLDTRPNFALLRLLASRTGGRFLLPEEFGQLDSLLAAQSSFAPQTLHRARDLQLWNWQVLLAAIIILFAAEWILRRRAGML
jgi:hypothetical protein